MNVAVVLISLAVTIACGRALAAEPSGDLPPLLTFNDGSAVETPQDWDRRKQEVRDIMVATFTGTLPAETPRLDRAEVLEEQKGADGSVRRRLNLTFATPHKASFETWVWLPPGEGPHPVLLTAPRYYQIAWAEAALARGYIVGLYPGVDHMHHEEAYPGYEKVWEQFRAEYPEATWTEIVCKGWLASRVLDYILDPAYECNAAAGQVGIIGHSRYGKQSMLAAVFDDRITSVMARSPGSPASCPYRFTSRHTFNEAPADFPAEWFLPSLRDYTGREHELPFDAHAWAALIAPRACMIHTAHNDDCEPTFAVERGYLAAREVYALLGADKNLRMLYREGHHNPITDAHLAQNMNWFDWSFGRGHIPDTAWPEEFIHRFDWDLWLHRQRMSDLTPPGLSDEAGERILWSLGEVPDSLEWEGEYTLYTREESEAMNHDRWQVENTARIPVAFGDRIRGNVYYNPTVTEAAPVVIWLHPYSYPSGYNEAYGVEGTTVYHRLAQAGYVVLAYDQCGFGLRLLEGRDFYDTHPKWSRLGRMVYDVGQAITFLQQGRGESERDLPELDGDRIYLAGYSLGGMVGLYAAALDDRVAGVASFCGFTPLRTDTEAKSTGGIRRLWEWHALQPRLGLFRGTEEKIPYDYDDIIGLVAPRPCLIVAPTRDREADFDEVKACVERAAKAWDGEDALTFLAPDDVNRFQKAQQDMLLEWLGKVNE